MTRTHWLLGLAVVGLVAGESRVAGQCFCSTPSLTCHAPEPPPIPNLPWPHPDALVRGSGEPTLPPAPPGPVRSERYLEPADPPRPRPGMWWYGATVPYVYQRGLYYPSWDEPYLSLVGCPTRGVPADDVYQGGQRAYWRTPGK